MNTITFRCESITPILMHGADGNTAELRPASIRGILRFWWRAIHWNLPLEDKENGELKKGLKSQEADIFGSTDKKSSFSIRVIEKLQFENTNPLPHKQRGDRGYHQKSAFKANQTFQVIINGQNLELIQNLFILTTTLGSFGQRSRRGFGSVQITKIDDVDFTPPKTEQAIKEKIAEINSNFKYKSDIQYPYIQNIEVGKNSQSMDNLLKKISQATHDIREINKNLFPTDNQQKAQKKLLDDIFGSANPRYASPIYISVLKFKKDDYRPIITTLHNTKSMNDTKLDEFKKAIL